MENIPYIDTSKSDTFKKQTGQIIKDIDWVKYISAPEDNKFHLYSINIWTLEANFTRAGLTKEEGYNILTELFKRITVFTNKDLVSQLQKACKYFNEMVKGSFIGVIEYGSSDYQKGIVKSKDWMMHEAMKYIKPRFLQNYEKINSNGTYVIIDDAVYSGDQLSFELLSLLENTSSSIIYLLIMFSTEFGINRLEKNINFDSKEDHGECFIYHIGKHVLHLWKGYIIIESVPSILKEINPENPKANQFIYKTILTEGATVTIFEHKLADYKSLVWIVKNIFYILMEEHYINTPPYQIVASFGSKKKNNLKFVNQDINYLKRV